MLVKPTPGGRVVCSAQPVAVSRIVHAIPPCTMPSALYMEPSGSQVKVMRPSATSTTFIRMSAEIGGAGKRLSATARQYDKPDIDEAAVWVATGSCQVITRDCGAPQFAVSTPPSRVS